MFKHQLNTLNMKYKIQRAAERGRANYGWLNANYYFSFSQYYDPEFVHFGALRVLNDDFIDAGEGFPTHPHDNMEIVTIPLSGAVAHKDNAGGSGIISAGDVQIMSAGSGVQHSEFNASQTDPLNLFQIWVFPKKRNIEPRYDQKTFLQEGRNGKWQTVVSPDEKSGGLWINQDAVFSLADVQKDSSIGYNNRFSGNGVFLVVIEGKIKINGEVLNKRDAIAISATDSFSIDAVENTRLLAVEIPMHLG